MKFEVTKEMVYTAINKMFELGIISTALSVDEARRQYLSVEAVLLAVEEKRSGKTNN